VMAAVIDVTERNRAERSVAHSATHDPLTDLPNRAALDRYLGELLGMSNGGRTFAILCIDLDRFKEINDLHGHSTVDRVLREVSRRLLAASEGTFFARIGGDEFIAVTTQDSARIVEMVDQLDHLLGDDFEVDGHLLSIGL